MVKRSLIEYVHKEDAIMPMMTPVGIAICKVGHKKTAVFYQGETLQSKFNLEKIEINCPANVDVYQLRAPQFVSCVVKDAKSKITPEQSNKLKQYLQTIGESIK